MPTEALDVFPAGRRASAANSSVPSGDTSLYSRRKPDGAKRAVRAAKGRQSAGRLPAAWRSIRRHALSRAADDSGDAKHRGQEDMAPEAALQGAVGPAACLGASEGALRNKSRMARDSGRLTLRSNVCIRAVDCVQELRDIEIFESCGFERLEGRFGVHHSPTPEVHLAAALPPARLQPAE